ncbi:MAG: hypothetical protein AAF495_13820 [Pseudomonadota bacterium]
MTTIHQGHQAAGAHESPFQRHARQSLRDAIITYGWDHPVVAAAQRSLFQIRRSDLTLGV